ncbi:lytic transglycosylase domain-containing protein [Pectobacterium brasiliense]|nr:lytic transglycosylase domain-containing protein [Pectobacterium brasiliense]
MCFEKAGADYGIDPLLLMSLGIKESHLKAKAVNDKNTDGTEDVCGMQINSYHYPTLAKFNIDRSLLLSDPCICTYTGGWVLADLFKRYGKSWDTVGMYNAGPSKSKIATRRKYAAEIKSIYTILVARKELIEKNVDVNR